MTRKPNPNQSVSLGSMWILQGVHRAPRIGFVDWWAFLVCDTHSNQISKLPSWFENQSTKNILQWPRQAGRSHRWCKSLFVRQIYGNLFWPFLDPDVFADTLGHVSTARNLVTVLHEHSSWWRQAKKTYPAAVSKSCAGKNKHAHEQLNHIQPSSTPELSKGARILLKKSYTQKKSWNFFWRGLPLRLRSDFVHRYSVLIFFPTGPLLRGVANVQPPKPFLTSHSKVVGKLGFICTESPVANGDVRADEVRNFWKALLWTGSKYHGKRFFFQKS